MKKNISLFAILSFVFVLFSCDDKEDNFLSTSTPSINFEAGENSLIVDISSNVSWWISCYSEWCEVSPSNGSGNGTIRITAKKNNSTSSRSTTVTVAQSEGTLVTTLNVYQAGSVDNGGGDNTTLSSPSEVNATKDGTQVYITWNSVSGASSYKVYRSSSSSGSYSSIGAVTTTYKYDSSPLTGYNYYKVTALNSSGTESGMSNAVSCNYTSGGGDTTTKPSAPTGVTVANEGNSIIPMITIRWNSVSDATSYKVYRSSSASGLYSQIGSSTSSTQLNDNNPLNGYNYYKVKAVNNVGESDYSSYASYNHDSSSSALPCPPTVSVSGSSYLSVSWTISTSSGCGTPTSYEVHKQNPNTGNYELVTTTTTSRSYSDNSSHPGINRYAIKAINSNGSASGIGYSSEVSLSMPTGFTATKSGSNVNFSWSKVKGATEYQIFMSTTASGTYTLATTATGENTTSKTYYYPASSGTTVYFKIKARWMTSYGSPTYVDSNLSSYKSVIF